MGKSLWFILFCIWFGLLMGGVAKASDVSAERMTSVQAIQKVSCQDFYYFRDSCGALLKVLTQDVLSEAQALKVSGTDGGLK